MLKQLYIKNFTLIDELNIEFKGGFSVITGETGAGKSIILGAIGLLLGQRADLKAIKQGADKCIIEAHFDLSRYGMEAFFEQNEIDYDAGDTIVRRELTAAGKSRAFISDTPVALTILKELGERLIDVHSQHQNLLLNKQDFQLSVVDIIAGDNRCLTDYRQSYEFYRQKQAQLEALKAEIAQGQQNADFLQFQFDELQAAQLVDGEQEELEQRCETMTHAEDIKQSLYEAETLCLDEANGMVGRSKRAVSCLQTIERVYPDIRDLAERMQSAYIELKDMAGEISTRLENVDFDPAELDAINVRLDKIYDLQKKYRVETVADLLTIRQDLQQKLSNIENSDEALAELEAECQQQKIECQQLADALTEKRMMAARQIEQEVVRRLVPLGMPNVRFEVAIENTELGRNGQDKVSFLFSANTSTALQAVAQVASGGEIARVMLSLKAMISGAVKLPTIIFDEIDTGVSGKIAEQMAQIMVEMGSHDRQVISITHLPQIAALGTTHYKVYKEETPQGTTSRMQRLSQDERIGEIAQMLSGSAVSEAAIQNAKELLKL
ncbi:MAG: DNA repair protein RecN [Prevotella sp.]|nr:DNA repair protein RecN [Prevotella sp.]